MTRPGLGFGFAEGAEGFGGGLKSEDSPATVPGIRVAEWAGLSTMGMGDMAKNLRGLPCWRAAFLRGALVSFVFALPLFFDVSASRCQSAGKTADGEPYSRLNTWSVFTEYSNTSQHIFLGVSQQRRIVAAGVEYARRLVVKRRFEFAYLAQVRPLFFESDPILAGFRSVATHQILQAFPNPQRVARLDHTQFVLLPQNILAEEFYGSQWTYGGGLNPIGFKWSFLPRRRLQPVMTFSSGFVVSTRDIPVDRSEAFNFTFELGFGLEYYFQPKHSLRLDYRVHHLSNAYIGFNNYGVDSNLFQLSYSFGK